MTEITCTTKIRAVSLVVEPLNNDVMGLKVKDNEIVIAEFELGMVWDFLRRALGDIAHPKQFAGIGRRHYEASNLHRLTCEWLEIIRKENE